jgi:LysM repeat protein
MASGVERYVATVALLAPLVLGGVAMTQLRVDPVSSVFAAEQGQLVTKRPAVVSVQAPPTLAPQPTPVVVRPTATPVAPKARTYTVKAGDQLKFVAAEYGVSIWKIIDVNKIDDPDSLRVGQVLQIPE